MSATVVTPFPKPSKAAGSENDASGASGGLKPRASLECAEVAASAAGAERILDISFAVRPGEMVGLMGPAGSGVGLLLDALSGLEPLARGVVRVDGTDTAGLPPAERAQLGLARTFAQPRLPALPRVIDLVALAGRLHRRPSLLGLLARSSRLGRAEREEAAELLKFVGLGAMTDHPLVGLPPLYRRLIDLARALAQRPKVLLLERPFAGLTHDEREHTANLVRTLSREGMALLLADHDVTRLAQLSERVLVMHHGRLIADGAPAEVGGSGPVLQAFTGKAVA